MRVGIGFDIHPFEEGRELVLGGVVFEGETGLAGHSDADVVTHAVIDALLGAAALGDIGNHFPDGDAEWKDAASVDLLRRTVVMLEERNYQVVNVDISVVAEQPRLAGRVEEMRERLGEVLHIGPDFVSVKATTAERMGSVGRGEGVAAWAVVLIDEIRRRELP